MRLRASVGMGLLAALCSSEREQRYLCHPNTDASGGHDIELPWVSAIQNETDCRAACNLLSNCSAYVVGNQSAAHPARFTCGGCWLKADPEPATTPLGPGDPFGQASCRKYCGKTRLPVYACAGAQCVETAGARVTYTDPHCYGQCTPLKTEDEPHPVSRVIGRWDSPPQRAPSTMVTDGPLLGNVSLPCALSVPHPYARSTTVSLTTAPPPTRRAILAR